MADDLPPSQDRVPACIVCGKDDHDADPVSPDMEDHPLIRDDTLGN